LCFPTQGAEHERWPQRGHWYFDSAPQEEHDGFGGGWCREEGLSLPSPSSSVAVAVSAAEATAAAAAAASVAASFLFSSSGALPLSSTTSPVD